MPLELTIKPEFHQLIPPLTEEELTLLEESILKEGCREALVTWEDCLLDGHNRYEICKKHNIGFKVLEKEFDNEDEAKIWIINNQFARRNLAPEQLSYLRGVRYRLEKKEHGGQIPGSRSDQNEHSLKTAEKIAKETGVSPATVRRDAEFSEAVDQLPDKEKKEVLSGKSKKTKKEITESVKKKNVRRRKSKKPEFKPKPPRQDQVFRQLQKYWDEAKEETKIKFLDWIKAQERVYG